MTKWQLEIKESHTVVRTGFAVVEADSKAEAKEQFEIHQSNIEWEDGNDFDYQTEIEEIEELWTSQ